MNNPTTVEQYNPLSIVKLLRLRNALPKSSNHSERPSFVRSPALSGRHLLKVSFSAHDPKQTSARGRCSCRHISCKAGRDMSQLGLPIINIIGNKYHRRREPERPIASSHGNPSLHVCTSEASMLGAY